MVLARRMWPYTPATLVLGWTVILRVKVHPGPVSRPGSRVPRVWPWPWNSHCLLGEPDSSLYHVLQTRHYQVSPAPSCYICLLHFPCESVQLSRTGGCSELCWPAEPDCGGSKMLKRLLKHKCILPGSVVHAYNPSGLGG
ncbi:Hypothetical predicted protein [Marmota monax]|uniref:Secreted protein n=1 Tax=Marmota monax TaxID=9995 RepID=A0A5E4BGK0_MARMO|nr:hypothetical protein GHT09_001409 [Marmota monax]VTJ68823.1 Hypothetical predicted protein [Marmota monax]